MRVPGFRVSRRCLKLDRLPRQRHPLSVLPGSHTGIHVSLRTQKLFGIAARSESSVASSNGLLRTGLAVEQAFGIHLL